MTQLELFPGPLSNLSQANRRVIVRPIPGRDAALFAIGSLSSDTRTKARTQDNTTSIVTFSEVTVDESIVAAGLRVFERVQSDVKAVSVMQRQRVSTAAQRDAIVTYAAQSYIKLLSSTSTSSSYSQLSPLSQIFSLSQLLLFTPSTLLLQPLQQWYKSTLALTQNRIDDINSSPTPHLHPLYWQAIVKALAMDSSLYTWLLRLHPDDAEIDALILLAPLSGPSKQQFMQWHREVTHTTFKLTTPASNASQLLSILKQDQIALANYSDPSDFLFQVLLSAVLTNPLLRAADLPDLVSTYTIPESDGWSRIVHALLRMDVASVVVESAQHDAFLACHLSDLILNAQLFEDEENVNDIAQEFGLTPGSDSEVESGVTTFRQIRDYLVSGWSEQLHAQGSHLASIRYLLQVPRLQGYPLISRIVHRIPLDPLSSSLPSPQTHTTAPSKIHQLLALLIRQGMYTDAQYIYTLLARRAFDSQEWQDAILFYLYSGNEQNVSSVVKRVIKGFLEGSVGRGEVNALCNAVGGDRCEILMNESREKGSEGLNLQKCKSVQFLFQFCAMQDQLHAREMRAAGETLGLIIESKMIPVCFECVIVEVMKEMCLDRCVGVNATYEGMRLLERVEGTVGRETGKESSHEKSDEMVVVRRGVFVKVSEMAKVEVDRMFMGAREALVKNLAHAYIEGLE